MLDLPQLSEAQIAGDKSVVSLTEDEKTILAAYCDLVSGELVKMGLQHHATAKDLIRNGLLVGVSLGVQLTIQNSQVMRRVG